MPPKIGFELTALELDAIGTARSIERLRDELERRDDVELVPLRQPGSPGPGRVGRVARGLRRELAYLPRALPRRAEALGLDLLHCPVGLAPVRPRVPLVLTVHDVMALEFPDWFTVANRAQQRLVLGAAARRAAVVLCPSAFTRERAMQRLRLDPERVRVTPWGVDERFATGAASEETLRRLGVTGRYLLTVGALSPRKNLEAALAAFELLAPDHEDLELVVAGGRGWRDRDLLARLQGSPAAERVRLTGRVSDEHLVELYRGAACFLFPSRYEGFGLPPLEAMACGAPVVASSTSSMPEVLGEAAALVDPDDAAAMAAAADTVLRSPERRAGMLEAGLERAHGFTWARTAEETVAAYRFALDSPRPRSPDRRSSARSTASTARQ